MIAMTRLVVFATAFLVAWPADAAADRPYGIDTHLAMKQISEIAVSPDGAFLAYTVSHYDLEADGSKSAVWMQPTAGGEPVRMTTADSAAWSPQWSPDNRYLTVLSDRKEGRTQEAIEDTVALAKHANVHVKVSAVPVYSREGHPFRDLDPHIKRLVDAYGPRRCFWASTTMAPGILRWP